MCFVAHQAIDPPITPVSLRAPVCPGSVHDRDTDPPGVRDAPQRFHCSDFVYRRKRVAGTGAAGTGAAGTGAACCGIRDSVCLCPVSAVAQQVLTGNRMESRHRRLCAYSVKGLWGAHPYSA